MSKTPAEAAAELPPLTNAQCYRVAALLRLTMTEPETEVDPESRSPWEVPDET